MEMFVSTTKGAEFSGAIAAPRTRPAVDVMCRALDLVVAALMVIVLAPLLAAIAVIIKLDSPGPVLFRQQRVGRHRKRFQVAKFRTMQHNADHEVHRDYMLALIESGMPAPKLAGDVRVTRFGNFLRRTSLDELPQLWNVLRGEMSLVGPRPPIPYEVEHYPPHWFARFQVKPGVTGLWQVSGRSEVSLEQMIELDIEYAHKRSLLFNLWILVRTIPAVLSTRGAG
jgi:lipopolysaccharide/colanic/teichoic acid biosynthesis glycosyltransferase